jgi:hypothetical protein
MEEEIVNRIAQSKLITLDLEDYYPKGERVLLDISTWLYEGLILREKEFRAYLEQQDWTQYKDTFIALTCSSDAIIPGWAYMLITTKLQPYAKLVVVGDFELLETVIFQEIIATMEVSAFEEKSVIIKGCGTKPIPPNAYLWLTRKIQPVAKSIMYGEACSSVPLFKKK